MFFNYIVMNQSLICIISSLSIIILYYSYRIICNSYHKILFSQKLKNYFLNIGAEII